MVENIFIMDQVHQLNIIVSKIKELKVDISESFQVGEVITKLSTSWSYYHSSENFTVEQLNKHLQSEEETCILLSKWGYLRG